MILFINGFGNLFYQYNYQVGAKLKGMFPVKSQATFL